MHHQPPNLPTYSPSLPPPNNRTNSQAARQADSQPSNTCAGQQRHGLQHALRPVVEQHLVSTCPWCVYVCAGQRRHGLQHGLSPCCGAAPSQAGSGQERNHDHGRGGARERPWCVRGGHGAGLGVWQARRSVCMMWHMWVCEGVCVPCPSQPRLMLSSAAGKETYAAPPPPSPPTTRASCR